MKERRHGGRDDRQESSRSIAPGPPGSGSMEAPRLPGGGGAGPGGGVPGYSPPPNWCDTDGDGMTNCSCGQDIPDPNPDGLSCADVCGDANARTECCANLDEGGCSTTQSSCTTSVGATGSCVVVTDTGGTGCTFYHCVADETSVPCIGDGCP